MPRQVSSRVAGLWLFTARPTSYCRSAAQVRFSTLLARIRDGTRRREKVVQVICSAVGAIALWPSIHEVILGKQSREGICVADDKGTVPNFAPLNVCFQNAADAGITPL